MERRLHTQVSAAHPTAWSTHGRTAACEVCREESGCADWRGCSGYASCQRIETSSGVTPSRMGSIEVPRPRETYIGGP
jgi:hypothetical protein